MYQIKIINLKQKDCRSFIFMFLSLSPFHFIFWFCYYLFILSHECTSCVVFDDLVLLEEGKKKMYVEKLVTIYAYYTFMWLAFRMQKFLSQYARAISSCNYHFITYSQPMHQNIIFQLHFKCNGHTHNMCYISMHLLLPLLQCNCFFQFFFFLLLLALLLLLLFYGRFFGFTFRWCRCCCCSFLISVINFYGVLSLLLNFFSRQNETKPKYLQYIFFYLVCLLLFLRFCFRQNKKHIF